jgi:1,3-propanediol dehydrogenase
MHAIELVSSHLVTAARKPGARALEGTSIACMEAGMAFSNAILGAVHALAHPLGGLYDLHHGMANSLLLPVVVKKNLEHARDKFARIASVMDPEARRMKTEEAASYVPELIERLIGELELPTRLSQVGVKREDIPAMAKMAQQDLCMVTNPYCYPLEEIESMYLQAW